MSNAAAKKDDSAEAPKQPLFFKDPHPLDPKRHADAGLKADAGYGFTKEANSTPITVHEFSEVVRSFPIVFSTEETPVPIAVLGLENRNSFVNSAGKWNKHHYIPTYIRRYPFGFVKVQDSDRYVLCVDEGAPHYQQKNPSQRFFEGEEPSDITKKALEFCGMYQQQFDASREFGKALKDAGLLVNRSLDITSSDGKKHAVSGFYIIDEDKWRAYAKDHIAQWEEKGYAGLVYLALVSQTNWKYLTLL